MVQRPKRRASGGMRQRPAWLVHVNLHARLNTRFLTSDALSPSVLCSDDGKRI
ncbi:MAG TPA: hypothetical protein VF708_21195 [Pyrinomonadaceae bacterium]